MKLGFVFNTRFEKFNGHYYSINLTEKLWNERYLPVFDEIVVIGRYVESKDNPEGKLQRSDFDRVKFNCIKDVGRIKRLFRQAEEEKFIESAILDCDVVICRSWWGVKACKKLNKRYLIEVVSCVWDAYWNHSFLGKLTAFPAFLSQRKTVLDAPYVLYVTKKFLQRRYPSKGKSAGISDVMLLEEMSDAKVKERIEKISGIKDRIVLGTAAAVNVEYKGQKYVIDALSLLSKMTDKSYYYELAGGGDNSFLKEYAEKKGVLDRVIFKGSIPHSEIFDWFDHLDIYIQPSFQEGLPRSVVEAMSRGLPCIGTDAGGIPELISDKYICKRNKLTLSRQIAEKIQDLDSRSMISAAVENYEKAKEFSATKLTSERVAFYADFASSK
jgi:glycosyltransferase involved in cell wall biosynthesis